MITIHFNMSETVAIMANRNQIFNFSIFPISINMMNNQNPFIFITAILTFFSEMTPRSFSIRMKRTNFFSAFFFKFVSTISATALFFIVWSYPYLLSAIDTFIKPSIFMYRVATFCRTKSLFFSGCFFRNKFKFTTFTDIFNYWLSSVNSTANITACDISGFVTCRYAKKFSANRTNFFNIFHKYRRPK